MINVFLFKFKIYPVRIHVFILPFFYCWRHDLSMTVLVSIYYTVLHIQDLCSIFIRFSEEIIPHSFVINRQF